MYALEESAHRHSKCDVATVERKKSRIEREKEMSKYEERTDKSNN